MTAERVLSLPVRQGVTVEYPPELIDAIAERVAQLLEPPGPEPWVDVDHAAAHLACSRQRIYDLVHAGGLPHRKDGRRLLFRLSELDAWLDASGAT